MPISSYLFPKNKKKLPMIVGGRLPPNFKSRTTFDSLYLNLKPKQHPTEVFQQTMVSAKLAPSADIFCEAMLEMNVPGVTYLYERLITNMFKPPVLFLQPSFKRNMFGKACR